jgi:hypothetical protein
MENLTTIAIINSFIITKCQPLAILPNNIYLVLESYLLTEIGRIRIALGWRETSVLEIYAQRNGYEVHLLL